MRPLALALVALAAVPAAARAQQPHPHAPSPYAGLPEREIAALSAEETEALLAGEGMGMALAAELNGHPGPRHVLELADSLDLADEQRDAVERVQADMLAEARRLGALVVDGERALDRMFAEGTVTEASLRDALRELATLRGELRATHLVAHLAVEDLLTPRQVHRYGELRGYGTGHVHRE